MNTKPKRTNTLQSLCLHYLAQLKCVADKYGLGDWIASLAIANKRGECTATVQDVELLAKMCDDSRIARKDIPKIFGKSYRHCIEHEIFEKIKKFPHVGVYNRIDALLLKAEHGYGN